MKGWGGKRRLLHIARPYPGTKLLESYCGQPADADHLVEWATVCWWSESAVGQQGPTKICSTCETVLRISGVVSYSYSG